MDPRDPDGKKLLVIHGDQFDGIVRYAKWLAILGDWAYTVALRINTTFNWARRKLGLNYWSLSAYLKHKVKNAVQFIADFEEAVASEARRRGVDGVVCGHIHHPEIRTIDGILYLQRRRLGGELHRAGRGFRGPPAHRALGRGGRARELGAAVPRAGAAGGGVAGLRIAIVSDAWRPQINGVVRTIETIVRLLQAEGHEVEVFGPDRFRTLPCPTYPEIRLSLFPASRLQHMLKLFAPDAIHVVTEGPLGWAARAFCVKRDIPFTTAYHTRFPEYVHARIRIPVAWSYALVRWFHAPSSAVLVVAQSIRDELMARGFGNLVPWSRGVDIAAFKPEPHKELQDARPIWLYAGRIAVEKNIKAFLDLDLPGTKWVVGGGPQLKELQRRYEDARFSARSNPRSCRRATLRPTASSSPAAPTPSAW